METTGPGTRSGGRSQSGADLEGLVDYCSRPLCRAEYRRLARGRRQAYCSEMCRRAAERELRQARSRLAHYEDLVQKLRVDVAAFGKPDGDEVEDDKVLSSLDGHRIAEAAVHRAAGALEFADPNEACARELRRLYEAVAPIIFSRRLAG